MLLKDTPVGDIEVHNEDEADARAFLTTLLANDNLTYDGHVAKHATHEVKVSGGKKYLVRLGWATTMP